MTLKTAHELKNLFNSEPHLLQKLEEAIKNNARNGGSIDKFFDNVKGNYPRLAPKTIAEQDELKDKEYDELRAFLNNL